MTPEMEIGSDRESLQINLDPAKYGTFAEIGAGQEVARRFFCIGGAAGAIAKTMSAYDIKQRAKISCDVDLCGGDELPARLARLQSGDRGWERMVPPEVVQIIKKREFFGYRRSIAA